MKRRWIILLAAVALVGLIAIPAISGLVGNSDVGQYYL
jgi:uncharacterized membrane protein YdfJ with MMPL/SSD domain